MRRPLLLLFLLGLAVSDAGATSRLEAIAAGTTVAVNVLEIRNHWKEVKAASAGTKRLLARLLRKGK